MDRGDTDGVCSNDLNSSIRKQRYCCCAVSDNKSALINELNDRVEVPTSIHIFHGACLTAVTFIPNLHVF
ncbi:hypothetical protein [Methanomethylovorans sp. PtaU1.Bin093]|uniref:hypothetical protein n=1 Tax=Methanomethylovorans sp. PtaU1.Bin093 TaxID=1811679 RepID=UPI0025F51E93|nr:hypothetical protein [Methanomethylovorans sp. PtaU1.Bin093]